MNTDDIWRAIHADRSRVADLLETLSNAQWMTPSLCEGWTIQDVVSHTTWPEPAVAVAESLFSLRGQLEFHARRRVAGLRLQATNVPWAQGEGPVAEAPIESILLALMGRTAALSEFHGPAAAELRRRFGTTAATVGSPPASGVEE